MSEQLYYIVCTKHPVGWNMSFWAPKCSGYSITLEGAGRYTMDEVKKSNCSFDAQHFPVPCEEIEAIAHRGVDRDSHLFKLLDRFAPPKSDGKKYNYGDI